MASKEAGFAERESALWQTQEDLVKARETIDDEVARKLRSERTSIAETEARKARAAVADDLDQHDRQLVELRQNLVVNNAKLADAQQAQASVLRKQRELDDAQREVDLSVEKKVQESLFAVREQATLDAKDGLKSKLSEKELQITGMQRQIKDLRRKAKQGSQQLQGEAPEVELEALLRGRLPPDLIEPVERGEFGGDILHRVRSPSGLICGTIRWESKRTKNWSSGWLAKLRDDQRRAEAEIALIVATALPKGVKTFDLIDGIWVTDPRFAVPLAIALRQSLVDFAGNRQAQQGQQTKMDLVSI